MLALTVTVTKIKNLCTFIQSLIADTVLYGYMGNPEKFFILLLPEVQSMKTE